MEYSASYTGAGLLFIETESLYEILIQLDATQLLNKEVKENNLLKINSESSRQRVVQEIKKRLVFTDHNFWFFYGSLEEKEKKLLLFYLMLKTYRIVYEFHFRVTVPMMLVLEKQINPYRYKMLLEEIASNNDAVAKWSEKTWNKLISRYMYMLTAAGLIASEKLIKPEVSYSFYQFFINKAEYWALDAFFLKKHEKELVINNQNDN